MTPIGKELLSGGAVANGQHRGRRVAHVKALKEGKVLVKGVARTVTVGAAPISNSLSFPSSSFFSSMSSSIDQKVVAGERSRPTANGRALVVGVEDGRLVLLVLHLKGGVDRGGGRGRLLGNAGHLLLLLLGGQLKEFIQLLQLAKVNRDAKELPWRKHAQQVQQVGGAADGGRVVVLELSIVALVGQRVPSKQKLREVQRL